MKKNKFKNRILKTCFLVLGLAGFMQGLHAQQTTLTLDLSKPGPAVSPMLYGLMTEEINHAYDGGLYAELIRNRAFLDDAASPVYWSVIQGNGSAATVALDR